MRKSFFAFVAIAIVSLCSLSDRHPAPGPDQDLPVGMHSTPAIALEFQMDKPFLKYACVLPAGCPQIMAPTEPQNGRAADLAIMADQARPDQEASTYG